MLPDPPPAPGSGGAEGGGSPTRSQLRREEGVWRPSAWESLRAGRWRLGAGAAVGALVVVAGVVVLLVMGAGFGAAQVPTPTPGVAIPTRSLGPSAVVPASASTPGAAPAASPASASAAGVTTTSPAGASAGEVVVDVEGRVAAPGVVRLPPGSRVDDAVRAAGGALASADLGRVNLARPLVDGEQVVVPAPGEALAGAASPLSPAGAAPGTATAGRGATTAPGPVDLNAATLADLDALPGVGPVLAQRVLDWRTQHGRFSSTDELGEVTGIGPSRLADLAPLVVAGP